MLLSLATIYAVPILVWLDTLNGIAPHPQGPRSIQDLPWINREAALLLQYQWNCFIIILVCRDRAEIGSRLG